MAKTGPRVKVMLLSTAKNKHSKPTGYFYTTYKNTRNTTEKLNLRKFDPRAYNEKTGRLGMVVKFEEKKVPK